MARIIKWLKSNLFETTQWNVCLSKKIVELFFFYFREHLEMLIDQLKIKLQDTQNNLQVHVSELQALQSEHDALLERNSRLLQETVSKEAELREK